MKLTESIIENTPLPALKRTQKLADGNGLYLLTNGTGARGWRLKFYLAGKEKQLSLGPYPATSLGTAREHAATARKHIAKGINPAALRQLDKDREYVEAANTFGKVGMDLLALHAERSARTVDKHRWLYTKLSALHKKPIATLTAPDIIRVLKTIEKAGQREAAHRCAQFAERVCRLAVQHGYMNANPAQNLRGVLLPVQTKSRAGITDPRKFGELMLFVDSDSYSGPTVRHALQLLARTFLRPGELRCGEWSEIDWDKAEWKLPASRMKMRRPHLTPLSRQSLAILTEQRKISGDGQYIFPGLRNKRPVSDAAMGAALKSLFFEGSEHVPHGWRSSASTLLNESRKFDSALVELQLSHAKRDRVASIYDRSQRVPERVELMQFWADEIDRLKTSARSKK